MKFIIIKDKEKQQTVTLKELERVNVCHFYLTTNMMSEKGPFDYQNSLISFLLSNKSINQLVTSNVMICKIKLLFHEQIIKK